MHCNALKPLSDMHTIESCMEALAALAFGSKPECMEFALRAPLRSTMLQKLYKDRLVDVGQGEEIRSLKSLG